MFNLQIIFNHMQRLDQSKLTQSCHYERSRKTKSTSFHLNLKQYNNTCQIPCTPKQIGRQSPHQDAIDSEFYQWKDMQRESKLSKTTVKTTKEQISGIDKPENYRKFPERYNNNSAFSKKISLKETSSTLSNQFQIIIPKTIYNGPPTFVRKRMQSKVDQLFTQSKKFNFQESFKIVGKLGQGKFGKVYKVKEKYTGMIFAMKVVEKQDILKKNLLNQFIREVKIHMYLRHENIIQMYGVFHDSKNVYVILQFACDGQLYQFMNKKQQTPSQRVCSFIMKNLLNAVSYLHSKDIFHRDIKPQNIVMIHGTVKLCDFGWAVNNTNKYELRDTFCGTPLYLSPQILSGKKYDYKIDLWAIGIIAYEIIFDTSPFQIESRSDLLRIITDDIYFPPQSTISKDFKNFLNKILDKDPNSRMSAQQLLKIPFIVKYSEFETCQQLCK